MPRVAIVGAGFSGSVIAREFRTLGILAIRRDGRIHEYSRQCGAADIPFYPIHLDKEKIMLKEYQTRARSERDVTFVGRLGTYQYLDMDKSIDLALDAARSFLARARPP